MTATGSAATGLVVTPDGVERVERGAVTGAAHADALVAVDEPEHLRRTDHGLTAIRSLVTLDALLSIPWASPVRVDSLNPTIADRLVRAGDGAVEVDGAWVTRLLRPALRVASVLVVARGWRSGVRRSMGYAGLAQRIVVLDRCPAAQSLVASEADVVGVGVWFYEGSELRELVPPPAFQRRHWKAASWSFTERAYLAWLRSIGRPVLSNGAPGRPSRTVPAVPGPHQLALPLR